MILEYLKDRSATEINYMTLLQDVEELKREKSPETKAKITGRISHYFNCGAFDEAEAKIAEEVLRLLARDAEKKVQKVLSDSLKYNPRLPHDVALTLAKATAEVAVPILEFSSVLTDDDLIEIVRSTKEVLCLTAVARRERISEPVSGALVDTQCSEAIQTLLENSGANISEHSYLKILEEYKESDAMMELLVRRGSLPPKVAAKMISKVSSSIRRELKTKYPTTINALDKNEQTFRAFEESMNEAKETAILEFLSDKIREKDARELIEYLKETNSLTPSIVLRALCKGDISFFECGLAELTNIPSNNIRKLILDKRGFESLYKKAGLPASMMDSAEVILGFAMDEVARGTIGDAGYPQRIITRIIDGGYDHMLTNMRYLMVLINNQNDLVSPSVVQQHSAHKKH